MEGLLPHWFSHTIVISSFLLIFYFSPKAFLLAIASYGLGNLTCTLCLKYHQEIRKYFAPKVKLVKSPENPRVTCNVCHTVKCDREKHDLHTPSDVIVSKELDVAFEKFYSKILENFVCHWYYHYSEDEELLLELRRCLKFITLKLINNLSHLDLAQLCSDKFLPCAIKHVQDFISISSISVEEKADFEQTCIRFLSSRLHVAATNRKNELEYLRQITVSLLPIILPKSNNKCRPFMTLSREIISGWVLLPMMDIISDPNFLNSLLVRIISDDYSKSLSLQPNGRVKMLENFAKYGSAMTKSSFDLSKILTTPSLLYSFMQFSKENGCIDLLQFCMDVDDFNRQLLNPDLSQQEMKILHNEIKRISNAFIRNDSKRICDFPPEIKEGICELVDKGSDDVHKFRISSALYKAYDLAFIELERNWLPLYYHSDEFYEVNNGPRKLVISKLSVNRKPSGKSSHKLKSAIPTEEKLQAESHSYHVDPTYSIDTSYRTPHRDMSSWNVNIVNVEVQEYSSVKTVIFCINVQKGGLFLRDESQGWSIQRRDQDFVLLKTKLAEFHGDNEINDSFVLPSKSSASLQLMQMKYEEFLQKLLIKPKLKSSDLLHYFLTSQGNFSLLATSSAPIENIYQSVTHKLRKEKGQHLNFFMNIFLKSVENKASNLDIGEDAINDFVYGGINRSLYSNVFGDNFSIDVPPSHQHISAHFAPKSISHSLIYLSLQLFHIPRVLVKIFWSISKIWQDIVDFLCRRYIERKLQDLLAEDNLVEFVNMLTDVVFSERVPPTKEEKEKKRASAFKLLNSILPYFYSFFVDIGGFKTLLSAVQNAKLNKQLAYSLLDIALSEMYPDTFS